MTLSCSHPTRARRRSTTAPRRDLLLPPGHPGLVNKTPSPRGTVQSGEPYHHALRLSAGGESAGLQAAVLPSTHAAPLPRAVGPGPLVPPQQAAGHHPRVQPRPAGLQRCAVCQAAVHPAGGSYHTHIPEYIPRYTWKGLVGPMWSIIRWCTRMSDLTLVTSKAMKVRARAHHTA